MLQEKGIIRKVVEENGKKTGSKSGFEFIMEELELTEFEKMLIFILFANNNFWRQETNYFIDIVDYCKNIKIGRTKDSNLWTKHQIRVDLINKVLIALQVECRQDMMCETFTKCQICLHAIKNLFQLQEPIVDLLEYFPKYNGDLNTKFDHKSAKYRELLRKISSMQEKIIQKNFKGPGKCYQN